VPAGVHSIRRGRCPGSGKARPPGRCGGPQSSHACQRIRAGGQSKSDGVRDSATDERPGSEPNSFRSSAWSPMVCPSSAAGSPGRSVCQRYGSCIVVLPCVIASAVVPANVILASVDPSFPSPAVLVFVFHPSPLEGEGGAQHRVRGRVRAFPCHPSPRREARRPSPSRGEGSKPLQRQELLPVQGRHSPPVVSFSSRARRRDHPHSGRPATAAPFTSRRRASTPPCAPPNRC
jgi:hypothetical protein